MRTISIRVPWPVAVVSIFREVFVPGWIARPWRWVWTRLLRQEIDAVTVGYTIYYLGGWIDNTDVPLDLRAHELAHVAQAAEYGRLRFMCMYAWEFVKHGYRNNKYEVLATRIGKAAAESMNALDEAAAGADDN